MTTANIIASVAIDHYGFLNLPAHPVSLLRILGIALMVGGVSLDARFLVTAAGEVNRRRSIRIDGSAPLYLLD